MTDKDAIKDLISHYEDINEILETLKSGETEKNIKTMDALIKQNKQIIDIFKNNL